ncbi:hypothetical protein [Deinococcus peraridilitoris]|uniref:Uncharacterized protein n=1 Tax=Deinococcus peraridilitoris (strain DSM 19664 / LMG 22246 / CIP 109416 / KR-200) TaxID=937777 RepID=K9ZYQ8_DEIPD|nr:hypothetical protein [Deinococcus peraridilitoris]AFZ66057.1 hypothetical protein Deipe_0461 [Deinococcus peraridilitoris DSM 19664]
MEHLTEAVEKAVREENWYAALGLALALPDICGKYYRPNEKSSTRYIEWFDQYVQPKYTSGVGPSRTPHVFLSGSDCYALRCAFLHEGSEQTPRGKIEPNRALDTFQFVVSPPPSSVHMNQRDSKLQLDVRKFATDMVASVREWLAMEPSINTSTLLEIEVIDPTKGFSF